MGKHYKEVANEALKRREDRIPKEYLLPQKALENLPQNLTTVPRSSGHFTDEELEIVNTEAKDILEKIRNRTWTSEKVTKAFCKASAVAQQLVLPTLHELSVNANMGNRRIASLRFCIQRLSLGPNFLMTT